MNKIFCFQIFCLMTKKQMEKLTEKATFSFWEKYDNELTVFRFATSWFTRKEDVETLCQVIEEL